MTSGPPTPPARPSADADAALRALQAENAALREQLARAGAAGADRERLLRAVLDAAPGAVVLLDEVGTIAFANGEARELFFEGGDPPAGSFLALLARAPVPLKKALLADVDHIFSFGADGAVETYHLSRRPLAFEGQPHTLLVLRNLTLEVSRRETAALRKAIGVIHHELANSLTPVRALVQLVRQQVAEAGIGAAQVEMLAVIEDRVTHLSSFLSGFASLRRLPTPRPQEVSWESFLGGLRPLLPGITIRPAPGGSGWMDPAQIQQIVINLVKNAREAGSPAAEIVLEVGAAPEGGHRVAVLDRGEGMSDEVLENAMLPSFTTKPGGSGMGLALCREIVDAHQGHLRIARRAGGGTAISFWLPPRERPPTASTLTRARLTLTQPALPVARGADAPGSES